MSNSNNLSSNKYPKTKWSTANKYKGKRAKRRTNLKKKPVNLDETIIINRPIELPASVEMEIETNFFSEIPSLSPISCSENHEDWEQYISASKQKITSFNSNRSNDILEDNCPSVIIDIKLLSVLVKNALCPVCKDNSLEVREVLDKRKGLVSYLQLKCDFCDEIIGETYTSQKTEPKKSSLSEEKTKTKKISIWEKKNVTNPFINNVKMVLGMRAIGIGHEGASRFFAIMGIPRPLHIKTFQVYQKMLHNAVMKAVNQHLLEIGKKIHQIEEPTTDYPSGHVAVMFDGTWQKRGHRSHNGVGVAIELNSGWVVDFEVLSNFCIACKKAPREDDASYADWWQKHKDSCQRNTKSSSHAMEMDAALAIWGRSEEKHDLKYTTFLSDGDSKAFLAVKNAKPYANVDITKDDCINHVNKRMGTGLRKLNKEELKRGEKLSDGVIDKLSLYYFLAISQNTGNIENMYKGILASLLHSASTDENNNHRLCPLPTEEKKTWCQFNQAISDGQVPPKHKPILSEIQAEKLKPLYKRLSDVELLKRCLKGKTQNPAESLNSLIWSFCPKHKYASKEVVETAVGLAVMQFNKGTSALGDILHEFDVPVSSELKKHSLSSDKKRIKCMERKGTAKERYLRRMKKSQQAQANSQQERDEPLSYYPGGLDLGLFDESS